MKLKNFKNLLTKAIIVLVLALGFATIGAITHFDKTNAASTCSPNSTLGTDTLSFNVTTAGTYNVWVRMLAPDTTDNSIYAEVDGNTTDCAQMGGGSSIPANQWYWVNFQGGSTSSTVSMSLTAGTHSLVLTGVAPNVGIDSVLFLDSTCVPTGTGTDCTTNQPTPPTVSITSPPSGGATWSGTQTISVNASDQVSVSNVVISINTSPVTTFTLKTAPYNQTWNTAGVANGSYTITATATDPAGLTATTTAPVTIDNVASCTAAPSTPGTLSATDSSSNPYYGVNLSWGASTAGSACTVQYLIFKDGATTPFATEPAGTTTFADSGLSPNITYSYYVEASDQIGTSAASNTASATTKAVTTPPNPPTGVTATAPTSNSVTLNWTPATPTIGTITGYEIFRGTTAPASGSTEPYLTTVSGANTASYTDSNGVQAKTSYYYQISAVDQYANVSTAADPTQFPITTPPVVDNVAPTAPTLLNATMITDNSFTLNWTASSVSSGTITGYNVYNNATGTLMATTIGTASPTTPSVPITGLGAETPYTVYVVAYANGLNSLNSATDTVTTLPGNPPSSNGDIYPLNLGQKADGLIDYQDLSVLFSHWGQACNQVACGDLNGTVGGVVGTPDLTILKNNWTSTQTGEVAPNKVYNSVYTKPNNECTTNGATFGLTLDVYSGTTPANTMEAWLTWQTKYLHLDYDYNTTSAYGNTLENVATANSSNGTGSLNITAGTTGDNYTGDEYITTLVFTAESAGTADVNVRWSGTGLAQTSNGTDMAPTPYGSQVVIASGSKASCTTSNNPGGGIELPPPTGSSSASNNPVGSTAAVVVPATQPAPTTNDLPATKAEPATTNASNAIEVTPAGSTTAVAVENNSPVQLSVAANIAPASNTTSSISSVRYYLGGTLLATTSGSSPSYTLAIGNYRNGTYDLKAKELLSNGLSKTINTNLIIKNPASVKQLYLQTKQYIWLLIAVVVVIVIGAYFNKMFKKGHPSWSQPIVDPDVRAKHTPEDK